MTNNFPLIKSEVFGDSEIQAVSVSDLYTFLELDKSNFSKWIEKTIINNDYAIEWEDYILQHGLEYESRNYILSIDFAKKISMRSNSKKWEEVRKYFLECEKRAKVNNIEISVTPRTYEVVMQEALLLADTRVKELEQKILLDKPKVSFATAVEGSASSIKVEDWIKSIQPSLKNQMGRNKAFKWLRTEWFLQNNNRPYQHWIDQGLFEVKQGMVITPQGSMQCFTTLITGKW